MNPFVIKGYEGSSRFCDREQETSRLSEAIRNSRDITLVSLRKMGKTGLLFHLFDRLNREKSYQPLYIDIYHTENLNGFLNKLSTALFRMKKPFQRRIEDFLVSFRVLRPVVSVNPMTGMPELTLQPGRESDTVSILEELLRIIRDINYTKPVVVAIDEFQQIDKYPEKNTEALLRGLFQSSGIRFIYSGSNKTMLTRMFGDASRPFYQSSELMHLEEIETAPYIDFIRSHFIRNKRMVDDETLGEIISWTRGHTWYVQYLCNRLFSADCDITSATIEKTKRDILIEYEPFYLEYQRLLTRHQWKLLVALARTGGMASVNSSSFISDFNLSNASTVNRSIDALLEKEFIFHKQENYHVYDAFFSRWLEWQR
jgi:hypothetical protein